MEIPKKIQKILDRRERLAYQLMSACAELDKWLEKNGADLCDPELTDSTISGCMIYYEPDNAKSSVIDYIENKM